MSKSAVDYNAVCDLVLEWNDIAGTTPAIGTDEFSNAVCLQAKLVKEEGSETYDQGAAAYDMFGGNAPLYYNKLLDGAVDTFVVLSKMVALLEKAGVDVVKAFELIMENNYSKFVTDKNEALKSFEYYAHLNQEVELVHNKEKGLYIIKDAITGKIKKPYNFKDVDLSVCLPDGL